MDLFSLSYRIQHNRYAVPPELVAEAIIRWHLQVGERPSSEVVDLDQSHDRERHGATAGGVSTPGPRRF